MFIIDSTGTFIRAVNRTSSSVGFYFILEIIIYSSSGTKLIQRKHLRLELESVFEFMK